MMGGMHTRKPRMARLLISLSLAFAVLFLGPRVALARDYSIDQVDIEATVGTDGSLSVKEVREFDFDGSFHGVYWKIPTGYYQGRQIETSVLSVGEIIDGAYVEFEEGYSGAEHTYELEQNSTYVQVKLYSSHEDEKAQFALIYRDTNLATRYDDTSELYWKFVSDGWDVESQNVTCVVKLPVPGGQEVIGGDNVRAWGHGPLDASLGFSNGDVVYEVPGVGTSEFAEARIAFPAEWLSETESVGYSQLDTILAEEQQWADEANARRARARVAVMGSTGISAAVPLLSLLYALTAWGSYKRSHKAQFDDKYFRDVPSDDHPAVLGALLEGGHPTDECLTASLMRLTDGGFAKLELVKTTKKGLFGREKMEEDYALTALRWPERTDHETNAELIDFETMRLMFDRLLRLSARVTDNADTLFFGSLEKVARKYPESFEGYRESWMNTVEATCRVRGFFTDDRKSGRGLLIALGILNIVISVASFVLFIMFDASFLQILVIPAVCMLVGLVLFVIAGRMKKESQEAIELKAKLKALKNWLKDFTRLEEAVPQDVVLWNRLLVMAVVLGVSDEVIRQLRVEAPQVLDDPYLASTYGWYYASSARSPVSSFTEAASSAHSVGAAKLAASSDSSGGGGGGGFSGGGGGGFGGGGGGGAF